MIYFPHRDANDVFDENAFNELAMRKPQQRCVGQDQGGLWQFGTNYGRDAKLRTVFRLNFFESHEFEQHQCAHQILGPIVGIVADPRSIERL